MSFLNLFRASSFKSLIESHLRSLVHTRDTLLTDLGLNVEEIKLGEIEEFNLMTLASELRIALTAEPQDADKPYGFRALRALLALEPPPASVTKKCQDPGDQ